MKERGIHMDKISMIGVDLGKRSFQLHGVREDGSAVFRKKVSRERFLLEVSGHGPCTVAMEACGSAHHRGRELQSMGFEVRLVPPTYVKPFAERHKKDAATNPDSGRAPRASGRTRGRGAAGGRDRRPAGGSDRRLGIAVAGAGPGNWPAAARADREAGRGGAQAGERER